MPNKRVLLISLPEGREFEYTTSSRENLGIEYIAASLREAGLQVSMLNLNLADSAIDVYRDDIRSSDVIGVSLPFWQSRKAYVEALYVLESVALADTPIVLGGNAATIGAAYFRHHFPRATAIVLGDGERIFPDMIQGGLVDIPASKLLPSGPVDLDSLAFPARDDIDTMLSAGMKPEIYVSGSRGCHYACSFCCLRQFRKLAENPHVWRARTPDNIVQELVSLKARYPSLSFFSFTDDNFIPPGEAGTRRTIKLAEAIMSAGLDMEFEITCRADVISAPLFERLRAAGLRGVYLGTESGSQRVLDCFKKKITVEQNFHAIQVLLDLDICVDIGFIMFNQYSELSDLEANLDFLERSMADLNFFVHPEVVLRTMLMYPSDLGRAAILDDVHFPRLKPPVSAVRQVMNQVWAGAKDAFMAFEENLDKDRGDPAILPSITMRLMQIMREVIECVRRDPDLPVEHYLEIASVQAGKEDICHALS